MGIFRGRGIGCNSVEQLSQYHDLLNTPSQCLPSRTSRCLSVGRRLGLSVCSWERSSRMVSATPWSTQDPRQALAHVSRHGPAFALHCLLSISLRHDMLNTPCWQHCFVLRRVHVHMCHLTSSGRLPLCAPVAVAYVDCWMRILPVPVTFTRSYGDVCLARTNRFALSIRSLLKEMKKSEHGGAAFMTCIRRTFEPGVDGLHTPST